MTPRKTPRRGKVPAPGSVEAQLAEIERAGGDGELEVGAANPLHVSSLGKMYFPEAGVTKGALMRYYAHIAPVLLPHLDGRPMVLKRYPEGVAGQMFFQQDAGSHVPEIVRVQALQTEEKGKRLRIIGGDLATLLYTVQLGAIEVHPWLSRVGDIESADRCLIDLDPDDDVPFTQVVALARDVLRIVEECGLAAAVKTSGSTGLHVVVPLPDHASYDTSVRLATRIAELTALRRPERATVERSIRARPPGTIYVDALQNARGKSAASAYSVRARPGETVSAPVRAAELTGRLRMSAFTVRTMPARIAREGDIWAEALGRRPTTRTLVRAMKLLDDALEAPARAAAGKSASTRRNAGGRNAGPGAAQRRSGRARTANG